MNAVNSTGIDLLRQTPEAFAPLAAKINEIIAALNAMQIPALGEGLHMVEAPQKSATGQPLPSKKLLTIDYAALAKTINPPELNTGGGGGSVEGTTATEGSSVEVIQGSDGKLIKVVKHSTATTPTAYPTYLKVDNLSNSVVIDTNGVTAYSSGANYVKMSNIALEVVYSGGSGVSIVKDEGLHVFTSGGKDCYIQNSAITRDMSIREIDVCDSGVAKKMLVLASAPY